MIYGIYILLVIYGTCILTSCMFKIDLTLLDIFSLIFSFFSLFSNPFHILLSPDQSFAISTIYRVEHFNRNASSIFVICDFLWDKSLERSYTVYVLWVKCNDDDYFFGFSKSFLFFFFFLIETSKQSLFL